MCWTGPCLRRALPRLHARRRNALFLWPYFLTGSTGYLGSYLVAGLFRGYQDRLNLLVRAKTEQEARERLWQSLQLHLEFPEFLDYVNDRVRDFSRRPDRRAFRADRR